MSNKRSSQDLDSPPAPLKQPRLTPAVPTTQPPQPFIVPGQPPIQPGHLVGRPSASLVGLTTGVPHSTAPGRPGVLPLQSQPLVNTHGAPRVTPSIVPVSYPARMGLAGSPILHPRMSPQRPTILPVPAMTPPVVPLIPPPPYSVSMVMPPASEVPMEQAENTCLSPSQFLHHPTSVQQSVASSALTTASNTIVTSAVNTSATTTVGRQPVCSATVSTTTSTVDSTKGTGKMSIKTKRAKILKAYKGKLASLKLKFEVQLKEKFFLDGGGNLMDFVSWKKKPNILRDQYLAQNKLDSDETANQAHLLSPKDMTQTFVENRIATEEVLKETVKQPNTPKDIKSPAFKTPLSAASTSTGNSTTIQIPLSTVSPSLQAGTPKLLTPSSPQKGSLAFHTPSPRRQTSLSSVYESSHEDIVLRARHEADVKKAIAELRKEGLWSACRLPKVVEPSRKKTHWDYVLEEMQWLATDFVNERRWKINAAKKLSRSVARYHQEREMQVARTEKEEQLRLRKIASTIAKEIKHFWESIQKVVEHKQQVVLEDKRKRAMDLHLDYIVDQTTKYSKWLVKGLATETSAPTSAEPSLQSAANSSLDDSDDFVAGAEESDNEETIQKEEEALDQEGGADYSSELQQLQEDADMPLDQLLDTLPTEILDGGGVPLTGGDFPTPAHSEADEMEVEQTESTALEDTGVRKQTSQELEVDSTEPAAIDVKAGNTVGSDDVQPQTSETVSSGADGVGVQSAEPDVSEAVTSEGGVGGDDEDYRASEAEEDEDEATISEQEDHEGEQDHKTEMDDLQKEGELPLEQLMAMYNLQRHSATPDTDVEQQTEGGSPMETSVSASVSQSEDEGEESEGEDDLQLLVSGKTLQETEAGLSDVAAVAEQFQPKGITLATTEVKTPVPFLLRKGLKLREYQHIGLDWLVAMHDRRLNGILADEMGLGKTIQTIALLSHLACEKGNWGPHLIIVPTSVMLNWELELKKWCPAFKILTYFGTLKERKQKRVGWSKRNAFHVCITSYNIAVTDHRSFKQKKWKYLILDEAQHIKNFKSQRWQTLLNFNSQRRLLLTGTPLQNSLMELWSLMHFLMPGIFTSHSDFKEWFSNPLTGMVEGSQEYNASIVKRLHQVLRPFLLHRRKMEVEKQMPQKYEHLVPCKLSKRQRFLYDEYMSRRKTKDSLASGNYLSVINILMQLRKVCNHPDLFEPRPIISPYRMVALEFYTASLVLGATETDPYQNVSLDYLNLRMADYEVEMDAFVGFRSRQLQAPRLLILDPTHTGAVSDSEGCDSSDDMRRVSSGFLEDLHLPLLEAQLEEFTLSRRRHMCEVNSRRCRRQPVYGRDLVRTIRTMCHPSALSPVKSSRLSPEHWRWSGHSACLRHQTSSLHWMEQSARLEALLPTPEERLEQLNEIIKRFVIAVPHVTSTSITLHAYHPPLSHITHEQCVHETLTKGLTHPVGVLHQTSTAMCFQFPETRLIQYDCGKLQVLDLLLQRLKCEGHRALIFTQMGRVLDVLEIFLNYHGHTYLRLDGSTSVVKRQLLMERFNRDERVFCFILSTRSGGLGVNLTGADTVIFYDSDWNPTMDAQAQDRCHRIGQTRDVHIYRLICTSTVEENILKKANQKKMLGNIAIEGGGFTTDFFKQASLRELFDTGSPESMSHETTPPTSPPASEGQMSQKQVEEMLMSAEDEGDAKAAAEARDEQVAELAEFDEAYSAQTDNTQEGKDVESDKIRSEFAAIDEQLNGVERYAMRYLEEENAGVAAEQLKHAEESIEQAKKEWELSHLQSLRQEEERLADEDTADDVLLSYDRPENSNKVYIDEPTGEEMPLWLPPTPPADDSNEYYVDLVLDMSYDTHMTISPAILAAIAPFSEEDYDVFGLSKKTTQYDIVKKSQKSSIKQSKEHLNVPPSLFWRRPAADTLSTKLKKLASHQKKLKTKDQFTPLLEQHPEGPDWMYIEDWVLLKSVTMVLEFPLSLTINVPAQTPNWSVVADITSSLSRIRRSPLQCREHLMNVVIPREDHTLKHDDHDTKKVKSRDGSTKKSKARREQRTKSLVISDGGKEQGRLYSSCFDWIMQSSAKRKQAPKFTWESSQKPSTHNDLLKEYGVQMDAVHSPTQVAQQRADRIQTTVARNYHPPGVGIQFKNAADLAKYNVPRQTGSGTPATVTVGGTSQKFPTITTSAAAMSPTKLPTTTSAPTTSLPAAVTGAQSTSVASIVTPPAPIVSTAVGKTTYTVPVSVSELGKTLIARSGLTPQQLFLLRQTTLQHQQQQAIVSPTATQVPQTQTTKSSLQQKIIPTGIEQLRASVGSVVSVALPLQQRFPGIVASSGTTGAAATLRGLPGTGRALQTEEVLALLKQQSLRMAATQQQYKTTTQIQPRDNSSTTAITQIQLRPEATKSMVKQQLSTAILQGETAKLIASTSPTPAEGNSQIKVEMIDQGRTAASTLKSQTVKLVPTTTTQAKASAAVQQVTSAQLQTVLALQAAVKASKPSTTQPSTSTSKPSEQQPK